MRSRLPWTPDPHRGGRCVTACLVADGHPPVSTLKLAWIYGDKAERRRIEALLDDAMMSTLHKWA